MNIFNFKEHKVRPDKNLPMAKAVKNHIRHVIAYTLSMEDIILIRNGMLPILSYNVSKSKTIKRPYKILL